MNPKTGIIILNYNGWYDTIECLQSVFQIEYDNYEVVLVDKS
jgi:GT2 family glycosyltransferase